MKVSKWGNSLAVRLPAELVARLGLHEGDEIELRSISLADPEPRILEVERKLSIEEHFAKVRAIRRKLPADYKFDREEAN